LDHDKPVKEKAEKQNGHCLHAKVYNYECVYPVLSVMLNKSLNKYKAALKPLALNKTF
jgi:hypothetical protein